MDGSVMYAGLDGLAQALEVQGGMKGPSNVRDDAGLYLHHEIGDYLSRSQTYQLEDNITLNTAAGAGDYTVAAPSTQGLRYGRFLVGLGVLANSVVALEGWGVFVRNSGLQPGYPAVTSGATGAMGAATARRMAANVYLLVSDPVPLTLPLWCPPGTQVQLYVRTTAAGGIYTVFTVWHSTEQLNSAGLLPTGLPRAEVKV